MTVTSYATNRFTGDGVTTQYAINFAGGYISKDHVKAYIRNPATNVRTPVAITSSMFVTPYTINLGVAAPAGYEVVIYRDTPKDAPLVDYTTGSRITEANLDKANKQAIFAVAELTDVTSVTDLTVQHSVSIKREVLTVGSGQTTFNLTNSYVLGTNALEVNRDGVRLNGSVTELTPYSFSVSGGDVQAGDVLEVIIYGTAAAGGGTTSAPSRTTYPNFTMNGTGPTVNSGGNSYKLITDTVPAGWNLGAGRMTVDFEVTHNSYFTSNPSAHYAIVLRQDPALISTAVRGSGIAVGDLTGAGTSDWKPSAIIESWVNGIGPNGRGNWLRKLAQTDKALPLQDGVKYRYIIENTVSEQGQRFTRFRVYRWIAQGTQAWDNLWELELDTGDVLDPNAQADWTKSALYIGEVFSSTRTGWSIDFANISVTWSSAGSVQATDLSDKLSRRGGEIAGGLAFTVPATSIKLNWTLNQPSQWTSFQSYQPNSPSNLLVKPSGSATTAAVGAINDSGGINYNYIGMVADTLMHRIETLSNGKTQIPLRVMLDGVQSLQFEQNGVRIPNAAKLLGQLEGLMAGVTNRGGANALSFASGTTFNIESLCTTGTIGTYINGNINNVEGVLRPLYCYISVLIYLLLDQRKIAS
jgi:hypothetical protein